MKKRIRALPYALLSLQFWRNGVDNLVFTCTVNDGDLAEGGFLKLDYYNFGKKFSECSELSFLEKQSFARFCRGYLENLKNCP